MFKKSIILLSLLFSFNSFSQEKISCDSVISRLARGNSLIFSYNGEMYTLPLENYYLNDIYTGDIHLLDMSKKVRRRKKYEPTRNWELFLIMKKNDVKKLK